MIQRIQSVYLLLITALMVAVLFVPFGIITNQAGVFEYSAFSVKPVELATGSLFPIWIVGLLTVLSAILAFVNLFFFRKRRLQLRLCLLNGVVIALFYIAYAVFFMALFSGEDVDYSPNIAVSFPLISLILDILAMKAISKDEALVQSLNRLR
jgi:hypothetical protein